MRARSKSIGPVVLSTISRYRHSIGTGPSWQSWVTPSAANGNSFRYDDMTMVDRKTPGYFRAKREGSTIPVSPMDSVKTEFIEVPGYCNGIMRRTSDNRLTQVEVNGHFWPANQNEWGVKPLDPSVDGAVALQEALSRAQSDCYDALTFAAEFRKTVEGVITLRTRAMTLWTRFDNRVRTSSRKRRYRGMEVGQILAEIWLELRYMWRPLVYDMISAQEAIRRLAEGIEDPLQRAYSSRVATTSSNRVVTDNSIRYKDGAAGGVTGVRVYSAQSVTVERTVHASVGLQVTTRDVIMTDPFVTGWELIPYSFILDWFVTIGDMLTAFSPFATGQLRYASLATTTVSTYRSINALQPSSGYVWEGNPSAAPCVRTKTVTTYSRVAATPQPTLAFDVQLNISKILDLTALWLTINRSSLTRLLRHF